MALSGFGAVLYYGILASVTGGYLPYRVKNWWLIVFHLYLFLSFIIFPLVVYLVDVSHWAGWMLYAIVILKTFLVLKIINFRLHKALDMNPELEEEEEDKQLEEGEGEGEGEDKEGEKEEEEKEKSGEDEKSETDRKELGMYGQIVESAESKPENTEEEIEESLKQHCDSASTLGHSSAHQSSQEDTAELLPLVTSTEDAKAVVVTVDQELDEEQGQAKEIEVSDDTEAKSKVEKESSSEGEYHTPQLASMEPGLTPINEERDEKGPSLSQPEHPDVLSDLPSRTDWLQQSNSSIGLMSPMHHSSASPLQSSGNIHTYISAISGTIHSASAGASGRNTLEVRPSGLQRSVSLPLNRERTPPGRNPPLVSIRQRRQGDTEDLASGNDSVIVLHPSLMNEEPDVTSVELDVPAPNIYRRRRGALRQNRRALSQEVQGPHLSPYLGPRTQSASATSSTASAAAVARALAVQESARPVLDEEEEEVEETNPLVESVKHKLLEQGHLSLLDVVEKMPTSLHESIVTDNVSRSCLDTISNRIPELQSGHLAHNNSDSSTGAIHWFEVSGEWNFYVFRSDHEDDEEEEEEEEEDMRYEPHTDSDIFMDRIHQEMLSRYGLDLGNIFPPSTPPHPPPRPPRTTGEENPEENLPPTYRVIPGVKRTAVQLKFRRRQLEEFMDRNVTVMEMIVTVFLAVLVCVVACLLLNTGFYRDFWSFWFCFVVATAHFSLIKSVQGDPASPIPGQNRITAGSRAFYFVLVGIIALCIDGALEEMDSLTPYCAYGFNINSRSVLFFVRDGLFIFILFFPVLFAWGLLPQADTFIIYLIEQIDMHIFGGTAATGLICAFYSLARSILATAILWCLGYAAFYSLDEKRDSDGNTVQYNCTHDDTDPNDPRGQCEIQNRVALSFFNGALVAVSFALSRSTSNHEYLWDLVKRLFRLKGKGKQGTQPEDLSDPLEEVYFQTLCRRLVADLLACIFIFVIVTALNVTSVFCRSMIPAYIIYGITCTMGIFNHYIIPHVRKEMPWLCCAEPIVKSAEWDSYEVSEPPKVTVMEMVLQISLYLEKNILYPLSFLFAINLSALHYKARFGDYGAALVLSVAGLKIFRNSFTELSRQYIVLIFTLFFFNYDYRHLSEGLPLDYLIIAILFNKFYDLLLKVYFIFIYIAPWQISWSSPGHIIIQPLLIPHTPNIFLQTLVAAIVGCPINPVVASTFFTLSYARPVKYWEKDYNTKRSDSSNTRLDSQLEGNLRNPNPDRLDSLFYEHLTWVLQKSLCGDLLLGRWGKVTSGDFFILTSDRLNALVHIIEIGNGFVTFQLRGLEFRGTYCHQREVEAITESVTDDEGCCGFEPGHLPHMLSCNKVFSLRWLAWEVVSSCYTIHGYSIAENQAHLVFNTFDYKRSYVTYYCKCIIYLLIESPKLQSLLANEGIRESLARLHIPTYVDQDGLFDETRNCDYSHTSGGVSRERFVTYYLTFISECVNQRGLQVESDAESFLVTLSFAFTLLGRRMFFQHAQSGSSRRGDNFMNGLYRMFLGDARPNHSGDEWVFQDVDSIQEIIIPAARIALKVHQDNFAFSEEYESAHGVYEAIQDVKENHVVTHENDRAWRNAVVMNKPSLLALRYQRTEDSYIYPYKLIRLTSKFIKFRVVKINRECVRALWTSQRQELIFLRNSDSERGSIQNHKPTLRNMINSSMDLPVGYPIYVSPLHTSFLDRHESYNGTLFGRVTDPLWAAKGVKVAQTLCESCVRHYQGSRGRMNVKSAHASVDPAEGEGVTTGAEGGAGPQHSASVDSLTGLQYGEGAQPYVDPFPDSDSDSDEQLWRPMWVSKKVVITNEEEIFESINPNWLSWPEPELQFKAGKGHWKYWRPQKGLEGEVVHEWRPFHKEAVKRSHIDKVLVLLKMSNDCYVLICEQGIKEV